MGLGLIVGCAVGIPSAVAVLIAAAFFLKLRQRLKQEDLEYSKRTEFNDLNQDLSYENVEHLIIDESDEKKEPHEHQHEHQLPGQDQGEDAHRESDEAQDGDQVTPKKAQVARSKSQRYVPAYRLKYQKSLRQTSSHHPHAHSHNSTSTSSGTQNPSTPGSSHNHSSSVSSTNTSATNPADFYNAVIPMIDDKTVNSSNTSIELARTLQQPIPNFYKKPAFSRSVSSSSLEKDDDYNLKNNYDIQNDFEIQEEDQYENEFSNYSKNKKLFIDELRPK